MRSLLGLALIALTACQSAPKSVSPSASAPVAVITELQHLVTPEDVEPVRPERRALSADEESQFGFYLYDPITHDVLEKQNAEMNFIPASTSKVPTTVAALLILGGDYQFKTYLAYRGKITDGTLHGDLYLKGTGDPALKVPHWMDFAKVLAQAGIRRVEGHFYYDESFFKSSEVVEEGREYWAPYNSGVSALSIDFNQFNVRWQAATSPSDALGKQFIYSVPELPFVEFSVLAHPLTNETHFLYDSTADKDRWLLSENQTQGGRQNLPIRRAALAAASLLVSICQMSKIILPVPEAGNMPKQAKILAVHLSPRLVDLANDVLEYSNNLMAELMQLATARQLVQHSVSITEAAKIVTHWVTQNALGQNYHFVNGSGLTAQNRISPARLAAVLAMADRFSFESRSYETLLPISGYKGSLLRRLGWPGYAFHVRAKTGSMNYTDALTGYLYTRSGRRLIFAIMNTQFKERARLEREIDLAASLDFPVVTPASPHPISNGELKKAEAWSRTAHKIQDGLMADWIQRF